MALMLLVGLQGKSIHRNHLVRQEKAPISYGNSLYFFPTADGDFFSSFVAFSRQNPKLLCNFINLGSEWIESDGVPPRDIEGNTLQCEDRGIQAVPNYLPKEECTWYDGVAGCRYRDSLVAFLSKSPPGLKCNYVGPQTRWLTDDVDGDSNYEIVGFVVQCY
ncbi:hypothetical protein IPJ70_02890 [Candidatus Campbellbacteria bacterium]|nr:MAG: hypothetical protein IPJ70_02890 [Candidatus Campbellbacteria bacterium]